MNNWNPGGVVWSNGQCLKVHLEDASVEQIVAELKRRVEVHAIEHLRVEQAKDALKKLGFDATAGIPGAYAYGGSR